MMREQIIKPFMDGFLGALRLFLDIVAAPWSVMKDFVLRGPRSTLRRAHR
jgi:hypothetical protein